MTENELSNLILGDAIKVHQQLGPGLLESVYEECLTHLLVKRGLIVERQKAVPVIFEEIKLECGFRCDIFVERKVIIEVKAIEALSEVHFAQVLTYSKLTGAKLGLLINFNVVRLKEGIRRVVNNL